MGDRQEFFPLMFSALSDPEVLVLSSAARWWWAALGSYTAMHGTNGRLVLQSSDGSLAALAAAMGTDEQRILGAVRALPGLSVRDRSGHGMGTGLRGMGTGLARVRLEVRWRNWKKYRELADRASNTHGIPTGFPRDSRGAHVVRSSLVVDLDQGIKSCESCLRILGALNEARRGAGIAGPGFGIDKGAARGVHARHQQHGEEACLRVVRIKARAFLKNPRLVPYFRPKTLFGPENFESYVREPEDAAAVAARAGGGDPGVCVHKIQAPWCEECYPRRSPA